MPPKSIVEDLASLSAHVARPSPHLQTVECSRANEPALAQGETVGLDLIDSMSISVLPDDLSATAAPGIKKLATALARDGSTSGAARRLAARDIAIARVRLRLFEALQSAALSRVGDDRNAVQDAESLQRMICAEHRRLVAAMDMLRRCERGGCEATVKINRAAIVVNPRTP